MRLLPSLICVSLILHCSYAPPVKEEKEEKDSELKDLEQYMEYHRYLKEVIQALESDPDFRQRLESAPEDDVRSGKIAEDLDFVNHNVRTKLDEIKRREMDRLRHLATKHFELTNNLDIDMGKVPSNEHLDHGNPHTFEIEDLKKLIKKTTSDLEEADRQRKDEFKEYEMQKEYEKHQQLEGLDEAQKKELMEKQKKEEEAKKHHQPLHHPGSKQQLEEVWEKQDHMEQQQFDPKAFFMMHDVDGNGVWDADEVKALFIKELDKMYGPNGPNKDLHERAEEMERMREHVFKENDHNQDGLIDFNEFVAETQKAQFNQDEGWKPIDENSVYTQAEYEQYERMRLEEMRYLQQRGLVDAHGRPIPGAQHQIHQALMERQQQHGMGYHPGQAPQGYPQVPQHQQYPGQQGHYQGQPQGQYQQPPQYQGQPLQGHQLPQGQFHSQQPSQGQYQGQQPPQGQFQGQQPPQQYQGQQPPQQYQGQQPPQQYQGQQAPQVQVQGQTQYQGQQPVQGQQAPQGQNQNQIPQAQQPPVNQNVNQAPQVNQGQAPPAQAPQGQAPQGQAAQSQAPQGQAAQGQAPTIQASQGQAPQVVGVGANH